MIPVPNHLLVGIVPNPYRSSLCDGCAFLRTAKRNGSGHRHNVGYLSRFVYLVLMNLLIFAAFLFFLFAFCIVEGGDISLRNQEFLRLCFILAILCIGLFLCREDLGILCTQFLHLRQFLYAEFIEGSLSGFVQRDFFTMGFQEFLL